MITNPMHASVEQTEDVLLVYKQVIAGMGGELVYVFGKAKDNYFRLKFALA